MDAVSTVEPESVIYGLGQTPALPFPLASFLGLKTRIVFCILKSCRKKEGRKEGRKEERKGGKEEERERET
jgi:hypothetical protein